MEKQPEGAAFGLFFVGCGALKKLAVADTAGVSLPGGVVAVVVTRMIVARFSASVVVWARFLAGIGRSTFVCSCRVLYLLFL